MPYRASPVSCSGTSISLGTWSIAALLICLAPLLTLALAGVDLGLYLEFPPKTLHVEHAGFSWKWWSLYATVGLLLLVSMYRSLAVSICFTGRPAARSFLAFSALVLSCAAAWNRWSWLSSLQEHTFLFVWCAYILFVNAVLYDSCGSCPLSASSRRFLMAFPISVAFWWLFEFLNRFTQNWYYQNVERFSTQGYVLFASLSFSTVLPSVWVTHELLSRVVVQKRYQCISVELPASMALSVCLASLLPLFLLPLFPNYLFGSIWLLPILLGISLESLRTRRSLCLCSLFIWALAGVVCGVLWELWNFYSVAKWVYQIPFVQRFHVFEMPLVGYGGYVPFGILCGLLIQSIARLNCQIRK
jgi:hypothetical protein